MKDFDRFDRRQLVSEFANIINKNSIENMSNTPDFIIAEYLVRCLENWNITTVERNDWFYRAPNEAREYVIDPMEPNSRQ